MASGITSPTNKTESATPAPDLITPRELAAALGMSLRTLARHYDKRTGPPRITLGRHLFYRRAAVEEWLQSIEGFTREPVRPRRRRPISAIVRGVRSARAA